MTRESVGSEKDFLELGRAQSRILLEEFDLDELARAQEVLMDAYRRQATVFTVGNGGSASTAAHFAADLGKYAVGEGNPGFRAVDLVSNYAAHTAWTNDADWSSTWREMLNPWAQSGDVVVAFSVHGGSGWSGNLVRALELANERGAKTIGFSGDGGGRFAELCDVSVVVPTPTDPWITPLTEGFHVLVAHLLVAGLRAQISGERT